MPVMPLNYFMPQEHDSPLGSAAGGAPYIKTRSGSYSCPAECLLFARIFLKRLLPQKVARICSFSEYLSRVYRRTHMCVANP